MRNERWSKWLVLCVFASLVCATQEPIMADPIADPEAVEILARARQAAGGPAWDGIAASHLRMHRSAGGLSGTVEYWNDLVHGRYAEKSELGPVFSTDGYDGKVAWSQDNARQVTIEENAAAREEVTSQAYYRTAGYWFAARRPAFIRSLGRRQEGKLGFNVLEIRPAGGSTFELWIDATTDLIDRVVETGGSQKRTIHYSDYRTVTGVKVPYTVRTGKGDPTDDEVSTVESIEWNPAIADARFELPPPPPPDYTVDGCDGTCTVPFNLINNHLVVQVQLNGKGPFTFLLDSGGSNLMTVELAHELGIAPMGALPVQGAGEKSVQVGLAPVDTVRLGGVRLDRQLFAVVPIGGLASVLGLKRFDGLIGYELFKRLVVSVDYYRQTLRIELPEQFVYRGRGTVVPFIINNSRPQVEGSIDGIPGQFLLDTGSGNFVDLFAPFVATHGLASSYYPKVEGVVGMSMGGPVRAKVARARVLELGGVPVPSPVVFLTEQASGVYTDRHLAGNIGNGVLRHFQLTFDYPHKRIVFEKSGAAEAPDVFDRSGLFLAAAPGGPTVVDVLSGSPAKRAGIAPGDQLVEIDGKATDPLGLQAVRSRLKGTPGTVVHLEIRSGERLKQIDLSLADLV